MTTARLTALIGPPGSGKSTYAAALACPSSVVLSSDAHRAELGTGPGDQDASPAAFALLRQRCRALLTSGTGVVVDATNTAAADRQALLDIARQTGARPVAVLVRAPLAVCLERNAARPADRRVPEVQVRRYWRTVARQDLAALLGEGWPAARLVDEYSALLATTDRDAGRRPPEESPG